jgi:hypothetical protein
VHDDTDHWPYHEDREEEDEDDQDREDWNPWSGPHGGLWGEDMLAYVDRHHIPESSLRVKERERARRKKDRKAKKKATHWWSLK